MVCDELATRNNMRCPFTEIVRKSKPSATKLVTLFRGQLMCTENHADKLLTSFGIEVLNTLSYTILLYVPVVPKLVATSTFC